MEVSQSGDGRARKCMHDLARKTSIGFAELIAGLGIVLFAPAGTLDFWQGWLYASVFLASTALITAYLWRKDPALLRRRLNAGPGAEKDAHQKLIQLLAGLGFIVTLLLPALDRRLGWSAVPLPLVLLGEVFVVAGFRIVFAALRENSFAAATIEIASGQQVVATGPYAVVRHPLYSGALVMLCGTPLALGSWWGLLACIAMTSILAWRLLAEEEFLARNLPGYAAYCQRVRYRLVPRVW
jgi:protein-S-isoprenylcysteine O-methyltransferase Ste14